MTQKEFKNLKIGDVVIRDPQDYDPAGMDGKELIVTGKISELGQVFVEHADHGNFAFHRSSCVNYHLMNPEIIQELDQMLEFCLKYNELESYIVNIA